MNFYQFASDSPILTFFLFLVVVGGIVEVIKTIAKTIRNKNE